MSCERYREPLADAAAGLPMQPELAAHAARCEFCSRELATLRECLAAVETVLRPLAIAEPSPELRVRIRRRIAADERVPGSSLTSRWRLAVAAALLAALLGWAGRHARTPTRMPQQARTATTSVPPIASPPAASSGTKSEQASMETAAEKRGTESGETARKRPAGAVDGRAGAVATTPPQHEPEVLVPAGEEHQLLRLAAMVQTTGVAPPSLLIAGEPSPELDAPRPLVVQPLEITPPEDEPADAQLKGVAR